MELLDERYILHGTNSSELCGGALKGEATPVYKKHLIGWLAFA
jgi:hypothetical protein